MTTVADSCVLPANYETTVLVVGEDGSGKSTLITAFMTQSMPDHHGVPRVVDPLLFRSDSASSFGDSNEVAWDLRHVSLRVIDTDGATLAGSKDALAAKISSTRPDVIMLCYSHGDPTSITRLANHWLPTIWQSGPTVRGRPNIPVCLAGLKTELFNDAPTFSWVDTLETCQSLVRSLALANASIVPGAQQALESLEDSLEQYGGSQVAISSARDYYSSNSNGSPQRQAQQQQQLDADACWHLCMSLLMSAWPNVVDQCEVSVYAPERASSTGSEGNGNGNGGHESAATAAAAVSAEVSRAFHKALNLAMHPVFPLFCPPYLQQAQTATMLVDGETPRFPGAVSSEDPSGFALAYNRLFHLYATQLPVSSAALSLHSSRVSVGGRDSRDSTSGANSGNAGNGGVTVDPRFNRIALAGFKALSRRTNGATLTEAEMQQSLMTMRRAAEAEEASSDPDSGSLDPDSLVEVVGDAPAMGSSGTAGHAVMLLKLPGLRQFLRNFVIFGYTTHAWQVLRRHGYVLADPQSSPLATWANDRDDSASLSSSSSSAMAKGRRTSFSNPTSPGGSNTSNTANGGGAVRLTSSGVHEVCLDWRAEFGLYSDPSVPFSTASPNATDMSLTFNRDGLRFLERLFKEQLAAQAEKAQASYAAQVTAANNFANDSINSGNPNSAAAAAAASSMIAAASSAAAQNAGRTWLSRETVDELFASSTPAGKHPFNTRLFPDVTRHNEQGGITMPAWLNLWRMLLVTSPETCFQALYALGFSKSAGAPGTAAAAARGDSDDSAATSGTGSASGSALRPMLKGVLGGSVDPLDDPRQAVKLDIPRKTKGPLQKAAVRRLFVVGSRGSGKSTLVLNYTCQGRRGFEQHLASAPGTRNGGGAPAPTNVPAHYVVEPPQAEDAAAIAAGILPSPSSAPSSASGPGLSPAEAAAAAQREEARRKALPEAFVITEWPAERLREAMEAAETQCDVLLLVAACTHDSVQYLREAVAMVPDNVPTSVALTQFEPSPSAERQREMVQARADLYTLCGRVDELGAVAASTTASTAAESWDIDIHAFTSPRSVKEKPLRELFKSLMLLSLYPEMDNPSTPDRIARKRQQALMRRLTGLAAFVGVTAAIAGAGYLGYTKVPSFAKAVDTAVSKARDTVGSALGFSLDGKAKRPANPVAAKKTLSLMQSVGW